MSWSACCNTPTCSRACSTTACLRRIVLAAFDAGARLGAGAARAPYACKDVDDQKFIDLAVGHGAILVSKDKAVLCMRKRLLTLDVQVTKAIVFEGASSCIG